ncbi:hypothetical protein WR25_00123 isoform B [Diploscapter pachys]|uniref:CTLH domain-containing protein n=1 Tax=Diploscapter pachys TaxID=2018661 RepID=A0A2A2KSW0_9BILA|nr:hypothetical protein WR25_00123 isoform B [Diploscapter pachys]
MSDDILGVLDEHLTKLEESLTKFGDEWSKNLAKLSDGIQHLEKELILDSDNGELSIMAQIILEQTANKTENLSEACVHHHKDIHFSVSRAGKIIDLSFVRDNKELLYHEKDLENGHACPKSAAFEMIREFLISEGRPDIAKKLPQIDCCDRHRPDAQVCANRSTPLISFDSPEIVFGSNGDIQMKSLDELLREQPQPSEAVENVIIDDSDEFRARHEEYEVALNALRRKDAQPALRWVEKHYAQDIGLRYALLKQHVLTKIEKDDPSDMEIVEAAKMLKGYSDEDDMPTLMRLMLKRHTANFRESEDYKRLYCPLIWDSLASRVSQAFTKIKSRLPEIIDTGSQALPVLTTLKNVMSKRQTALLLSEELPIELKVPRHYHSLFTCPILKVQVRYKIKEKKNLKIMIIVDRR